MEVKTLTIKLSPGRFSADEVRILCAGIIKEMKDGAGVVIEGPKEKPRQTSQERVAICRQMVEASGNVGADVSPPV
jgi:hypothetical protein